MTAAGGACAAVVLALCLAGCASAPRSAAPPPRAATPTQPPATPRKVSPYAPAQEDLSKRGDYTAGGLYKPGVPDSVPDEVPQVDLIPEPEVVAEPRSRYGNRSPYSVLGKSYRVMDDPAGYVERGIASYYGQKFHGRRTSSLEVYDMYAFTAAHKTLPLPSYARVTNLANGASVVVRVNDRGPFHEGRIIDLSYAAAVKLGIHRAGTGQVEVRALVPEAPDPAATASTVTVADAQGPAPPVAAATPALPATPMDALVAELPVGTVTLQVGSFASQANAERAVARLAGAGIAGAHVIDPAAEGRALWRVRVGPVDEAAAGELARRVQGLGFEAPGVVRGE